MSNELLMAKGRLADCEKQISDAELKAENYMIALRELLDPYRDFADLELEKALLLLKDFRGLQLEVRELRTLGCRLKRDYNL